MAWHGDAVVYGKPSDHLAAPTTEDVGLLRVQLQPDLTQHSLCMAQHFHRATAAGEREVVGVAGVLNMMARGQLGKNFIGPQQNAVQQRRACRCTNG